MKFTVALATAAPPVVRVRVAERETGPVDPKLTEAGLGADRTSVVATFAAAAGDTVTTASELVCVQSPVGEKSFDVRAIVLQVDGVATATLGAVAVKTSLIVSAALLPLVRLSRWLFAVERN